MSYLQLADISRKMAQEARLLDDNLTDAEKLRLGILLGYLKHGLRKVPGGFDIVPVPINMFGGDYSNTKSGTGYRNKKLSMASFLLQPEEAQFFSMSPKDKHGQVQLQLKVHALIANPSREMRALLPNVDWEPLPSLETVMTDSSDGEEEGDGGTVDRSSTPGHSAPQSLFNSEPRHVGFSCSSKANIMHAALQ